MNQRIIKLSKSIKSLAFALIFTAIFSISGWSQSITLLSPNGGEVWTAGSYETVTWTGQNLGYYVLIEFSPDGGNSWWYNGEFVTGPDGGSASVWTYYYATTNAILRISDYNYPYINDVSDAPFTNYAPPITILQPYGTSAIFVNSLTTLSWLILDNSISLINVEISIDNGLRYTTVAQNIDAYINYRSFVLSDTPSETCILKISNASNPSVFALSEVFTISPLPVYTITSPAGGEIFNRYSPITISWTVQDSFSDDCDLEISTDNGQTWAFINSATSTGNFGSYVWNTPNINSVACLIRIRDLNSQASTDVSEVFTIMPFPEIPICMVTVDSLTNHNVIIWEKSVSNLISDFLVYKETDQAGSYEVIATVGNNDVPMVTDEGSNPAMRPYRYKVGFRDIDNRIFPAGNFHQTIHLTINQGFNNNWNLIWTTYIGFNYNSYKIMRKSGNGPYEQIATISASFNSFTDFNAPSGNVSYMIKIEHPSGCSIGLRNNDFPVVYSNEASLTAVSVADNKEVNFNIFPVPANDKINIQFGDNAKGMINLTITDVAGRIMFSEEYNDADLGQLYLIDVSNFAEGIYLLNVISDKEKSTKKFSVRR
ncbi:MAG: T9SS type A sorting domain-containing protein [Bacteroidales bacterium]|nr:T9SS type A sorting domain-containing protein [Bacteroidales bacterium]